MKCILIKGRQNLFISEVLKLLAVTFRIHLNTLSAYLEE